MKYHVVYSKKALQDIRDLYGYISYQLFAPESAKKLTRRITELIASLAYMPERFKIYDSEPWRSRGLRSVPVDNHIIFYLVDNERNEVTIMRVMYGGKNIESELSNQLQ